MCGIDLDSFRHFAVLFFLYRFLQNILLASMQCDNVLFNVYSLQLISYMIGKQTKFLCTYCLVSKQLLAL